MSRPTQSERLDAALELLGLNRHADVDAVRKAYRHLMLQHHPDVSGGDGTRAQRYTEAHAAVSAAFDDAGLLPPPPQPTSDRPAAEPRYGARRHPLDDRAAGVDAAPLEDPLNDEDSLTLIAPAEDVFLAMYDALQAVGDVTYVDRDGGLLEALVAITDQPPSQLLVTFQGRSHGIEAMFTLTANGNETPPAIGAVVERVAHALQRSVTEP